MADAIQLRVLTEGGVAVEDEAVSVIAPAEDGYVGFLRNHAPLVTTLGRGRLVWRRPDGPSKTLHVDSGFLEIVHNHLTVLTTITTAPDPTTPSR